MKLLHLADLHIGKQKNKHPILNEQKILLMQAVHMAVEHKAAAVLIAGDIYDRPMPPADAVQLFDFFLEELSKENIPVCIISGNHDPANRLLFGKDLQKSAPLFIAEAYQEEISRVTFADEFGEADIYLLPFFMPQQIRERMIKEGVEESQLENYTEAVKTALQGLPLRKQVRNVLVTHHNVIENVNTSNTEDGNDVEIETNSTKDVDIVDYRVFDAFDYVALGHVHDEGQVGRATVRYAGALVDYSDSEEWQLKSATLVTLKEKGSIAIERLAFLPPCDEQKLKDMEEIKKLQEQLEMLKAELADCQVMEKRLLEFQNKKEELEELLWQQDESVLEEEEKEEAKRRLFFAKKAVLSVRPLKEAYLAAKQEREELFGMIKSKERQLALSRKQEENTILHYQKAQVDKSKLKQLSVRVETAKAEAESVKQCAKLIGQYKEKSSELAKKESLFEERMKRQKELEEECAACRRAAERLVEIYHAGTKLEKEEQEVKRRKAALIEQKKQFESYETMKKNYEYLTEMLNEKRERQKQLTVEQKKEEAAALQAEIERLSDEAVMEQGTMQVLLEYMARPRDGAERPRFDSVESYEKEEKRLSDALSKVLSEIEALLKEQTLCIQAKKRVPELEQKIAQEREAIDLQQDVLRGIRSELRGMEEKIKEMTLSLHAKSEEEANHQLSGLLKEQEQKRQEIADAETAYYQWADAKHDETEVLEQLLGQKAARVRREQSAEEAYFAALKAAGFNSEAEYERAVLDEARIEELEQQSVQKEMEMLKRKERIRILKQETAQGGLMDIGFLQKRMKELQEKIEVVEDKILVLCGHTEIKGGV